MNIQTPPKAATTWDRATGQSRYAADLIPPGTAAVGMARSPRPHARVTRINAQAALEVPGVLGVLTPEDFEGVRLGHLRVDEPVLARVVRYVGDGVAAVAAEDLASLSKGIEALEVDYELLPHALSVDAALGSAVPIHDECPDNVAERFSAERGDWEAAAARVSLWAENTFEIEAVPHAYLEPRACLVRVTSDHLELVTGTHAPSVAAAEYRSIIEPWGATLEIVTPDIGGSFGAKWEHPTHLVCLAFAHRLRRDVAMVLPRRDDMIAGRTRLAMRIHMRLGATADGELIAKETTIWADNGAYSLHGPAVTQAAAIRPDNLYRFGATKVRSQLVYTNNLPSECFRGFGIPQAAFAQEQLVDELARGLKLDAAEMRRANAVRAGDISIHGWRIGSCGFDDCLDAVSRRLDEHRQRASQADRKRYRTGYGIAANIHCISNRGYNKEFDRAHVTLTPEVGGTISIGSGEVELGAGTVEILMGTVGRELDISREKLRTVLGDTAHGPQGLGSFASRTSFFNAWAALDACNKFKTACEKLTAELGANAETTVADVIDLAQRHDRLADLFVTGTYEPLGVEYPDESGYGNISAGYTFGVHGCCVKIDVLTGKVTVEQYWAAHDAGTITNPNGAMGQVTGAVVQGLGFALTEAVAVDDDGRLLNPGYLDDRVVTFADAIPIEVHFAPTFEDAGPAGAKTIGEQPIIPVAACVANAIYDALGVRQTHLPMNSERVWRSLRDHAEKKE